MEKGQFVTVSEWMTHGNIMQFIKNNSVNRLELVRGFSIPAPFVVRQNATIVARGILGSEVPPWCRSHTRRPQRGQCLFVLRPIPFFDAQQANILMSNDTPPHACLADFSFMTDVFDPGQPMSCSAQLEGGTMTFMSAELMVPSRFGFKDSIPTPEPDIDWLSSRYTNRIVSICRLLILSRSLQAKTHSVAFGWGRSFNVVMGARPTKPKNASAIGFSDSLWQFAQQCWHGDAKVRPKVGEVVTRLERAAAYWGRIMPPFVKVENIVPVSEKSVSSDSMSNCEFEILFPH